jgi:hypothetical protein
MSTKHHKPHAKSWLRLLLSSLLLASFAVYWQAALANANCHGGGDITIKSMWVHPGAPLADSPNGNWATTAQSFARFSFAIPEDFIEVCTARVAVIPRINRSGVKFNAAVSRGSDGDAKDAFDGPVQNGTFNVMRDTLKDVDVTQAFLNTPPDPSVDDYVTLYFSAPGVYDRSALQVMLLVVEYAAPAPVTPGSVQMTYSEALQQTPRDGTQSKRITLTCAAGNVGIQGAIIPPLFGADTFNAYWNAAHSELVGEADDDPGRSWEWDLEGYVACVGANPEGPTVICEVPKDNPVACEDVFD